MRIAILDDNQLDIDYFKARAESFLKKKGDRTYQISEYTSGVPLVDDVKDGEWFDLIVLDIILKDGESGVDVAYKLRGSGYSGSLMFWTVMPATCVMLLMFEQHSMLSKGMKMEGCFP